jgi:hypothetical protein
MGLCGRCAAAAGRSTGPPRMRCSGRCPLGSGPLHGTWGGAQPGTHQGMEKCQYTTTTWGAGGLHPRAPGLEVLKTIKTKLPRSPGASSWPLDPRAGAEALRGGSRGSAAQSGLRQSGLVVRERREVRPCVQQRRAGWWVWGCCRGWTRAAAGWVMGVRAAAGWVMGVRAAAGWVMGVRAAAGWVVTPGPV